MAYTQEKKEDVYGFQTYFRETGYYLQRGEYYEKSLGYFNEAIEKTTDDRRAYLGRTYSRLKLGLYNGALEDTEALLARKPNDLIVLANKSLLTYLKCDFEKAYIQNIRLVPKRKKPDNFITGVMHCTEAIENCIGNRSGHPLRDYYKVVRKLAWKKAREAEKPFQLKPKYLKKKKKKAAKKKAIREPVAPKITKMKGGKGVDKGNSCDLSKGEEGKPCKPPEPQKFPVEAEELQIRDSLHSHKTESDYVPPGKRYPFRPLQRYTTNIANCMAEKYLERMYLDKIFLDNMQTNPGTKCPNKGGSKKVMMYSKDGFKDVSYKQELLRSRRPFYFIKYQEAHLSGALKSRAAAELHKMQKIAVGEADELLYKIEESIADKKTKVALDLAEKLKQYCDAKPKKVLPNREQYLAEMYKLVGQANVQLFRINKKQYEWDQEKRIYLMLGSPLSRDPSTDSIIPQFKGMFVDWKKQVSIAEERLRKATTAEEMAWLYHDLSSYHTELKQYELGRVYARKCIAEGRRANNLNWVINAMMLITKINMQQHNRNDAKIEVNEAIEVAKEMKSKTLLDYFQKCLQVIDKIDFEDFHGPKVLEKREKQIVDMMSGYGMKDEAAFLFRKMSVMPAARRMSVMPGVRLEDTEKPTATARKMSIKPGAKDIDEEPSPRQSMAAGKHKKSEAASEQPRGVGFMELIQYHVD